MSEATEDRTKWFALMFFEDVPIGGRFKFGEAGRRTMNVKTKASHYVDSWGVQQLMWPGTAVRFTYHPSRPPAGEQADQAGSD